MSGFMSVRQPPEASDTTWYLRIKEKGSTSRMVARPAGPPATCLRGESAGVAGRQAANVACLPTWHSDGACPARHAPPSAPADPRTHQVPFSSATRALACHMLCTDGLVLLPAEGEREWSFSTRQRWPRAAGGRRCAPHLPSAWAQPPFCSVGNCSAVYRMHSGTQASPSPVLTVHVGEGGPRVGAGKGLGGAAARARGVAGGHTPGAGGVGGVLACGWERVRAGRRRRWRERRWGPRPRDGTGRPLGASVEVSRGLMRACARAVPCGPEARAYARPACWAAQAGQPSSEQPHWA